MAAGGATHRCAQNSRATMALPIVGLKFQTQPHLETFMIVMMSVFGRFFNGWCDIKASVTRGERNDSGLTPIVGGNGCGIFFLLVRRNLSSFFCLVLMLKTRYRITPEARAVLQQPRGTPCRRSTPYLSFAGRVQDMMVMLSTACPSCSSRLLFYFRVSRSVCKARSTITFYSGRMFWWCSAYLEALCAWSFV